MLWALALAPTLAGRADAATLSFLHPHGPIANVQRGDIINFCLLLLVIVLPVLLLTPLFAWRYRFRNTSAQYRPWWSFSWPLEVAIWGVPIAVVVALAVWLWRGTQALDPYASISSSQPSLPVEVVGFNWKWLFIYPTLGIASIGRFPIPADRPLAIKLTSETVMQSFFIPALGSQIYAMAGMVTQLNLKAEGMGIFMGENTQYNGAGFQRQKFTAVAMSPAHFSAWAMRVKTHGIPMTAATYNLIRQQTTAPQTYKALNKVLKVSRKTGAGIYFRNVSPHLFRNIVHSFHGGSTNAAVLVGEPTARAGSGADASRQRAGG